MNKTKLNILFTLFFIVLLPGFAFAQSNCTSEVSIIAPDSAMVFINDKLAGRGSLKLELAKGKYAISLKDQITNWGNEVVSDSIEVNNCGETKQVNLARSRNLFINSNPADAAVYSNDSLLGYTPLKLKADVFQIELRKESYRSIVLKGNEIIPGNIYKLDFTGKLMDKNFLKTSLFKYLAGSAIILGSAAAYYKLKANNNFDQYNSSGDKSYLDKTNKFDLISGITFGLLQVDFGVLLYYFLTD